MALQSRRGRPSAGLRHRVAALSPLALGTTGPGSAVLGGAPRGWDVGAGEEGNSAESVLTRKHPAFCRGKKTAPSPEAPHASPSQGGGSSAQAKRILDAHRGSPRKPLSPRPPPLEKPCSPLPYTSSRVWLGTLWSPRAGWR